MADEQTLDTNPQEQQANEALAGDELAARVQSLEEQLAAAQDQSLRMAADLQNVRRRAEQDVEKAHKFALEKFSSDLLPVIDSLELALAHSSAEDENVKQIREGVELTLRQLVSAFEGAKLAEENPLGQKFDPNKHQAISMVEADAEPNTVVTVLQKGYLLNERVIRPAMVMVAKAKA